MSLPTLLVADDHPLFRAALIQVLHDRYPQFRIVEAASAQTVGTAMQEHPEIELVLLDLAMPGARGFSSLLHLRGEYPQVPVIVISSNDDSRIIRRAQQFGAAGFISKSAAAEDMSAAIDDVLNGDVSFPSMVAERSEADAELAARLAQQTGARVVLAWGERLAGGKGFRVCVRPFDEVLSADVVQATLQINRAMECVIHELPGQYLWGYARYKQPRQPEGAPEQKG